MDGWLSCFSSISSIVCGFVLLVKRQFRSIFSSSSTPSIQLLVRPSSIQHLPNILPCRVNASHPSAHRVVSFHLIRRYSLPSTHKSLRLPILRTTIPLFSVGTPRQSSAERATNTEYNNFDDNVTRTMAVKRVLLLPRMTMRRWQGDVLIRPGSQSVSESVSLWPSVFCAPLCTLRTFKCRTIIHLRDFSFHQVD